MTFAPYIIVSMAVANQVIGRVCYENDKREAAEHLQKQPIGKDHVPLMPTCIESWQHSSLSWITHQFVAISWCHSLEVLTIEQIIDLVIVTIVTSTMQCISTAAHD